MASTNLDLVRSIFAAWGRGDFSSIEWAHPEIEFVIADGPSPGRWTALSGMAEASRRSLIAWEAFRVQADECRELDVERVPVVTRLSGRGKASGLELGEVRTTGAGAVPRSRRQRDQARPLLGPRARVANLGLAE